MRVRCTWILTGWLMAGLLALPANVNGQGATQASITGIVRDASGAVLPGVTVEASSDALIEKVRVGITDATGRYRIAGLPPGTYNMTFTLTGFSTVRREGLALAGSFVATVDVSLQVGALAETITVTGETPVVDVSERAAPAGHQQRGDGVDSGQPLLREPGRAGAGDPVGHDRAERGRDSRARAAVLYRAWREQLRRPAAHRRDDHRRLHWRRLAHGARYRAMRPRSR